MKSKKDKNSKNDINDSLKDLSKNKELEKVSGGTYVYDTSGKYLYDRGALKGAQDHKYCPKCGGYGLIDNGSTGFVCKDCGYPRNKW